MIKKIKLILLVIILMASGSVYAADRITPEVASAISKYKSGNYTGCIKDLNNYISRNQYANNQLAYYYLGMAYTRAGDKEKAENFYKKTSAINANNTLGMYAKRGIACINGEQACYEVKKEVQEKLNPLDKFVYSPYGNGLSSDLTKEIERNHLEKLRKEMNNSEELNKYEFKDFRDFSNKKSESESREKNLKIASSKPSDKEVLKAIKVLNDAGLSNIAQQAQIQNEQKQQQSQIQVQTEEKNAYKPDVTREQLQQQMQKDMMAIQMSAYTQPNVNMLFGNQQQQNSNADNNMMNMLPFIMAQQAQSGQQTMSPEIMQALMYNSMMPNLNMGSGY